MGSNQVKAITSPYLHVESRALSYQDEQERIFKKGLKRRLGSDILAHWIQMKRREKEVVEKVRIVVSEGKAPPELLQEVEMCLVKEKRPHIKYHPKILPKKPKPTKSRFKGPKLNHTAALRIQDSYERREREQRESSEGETSQRSRSRVSLRSHGWTERSTLSTAAATKSSKQQKRASSLPPSSNLSLQSITTAESSGIGMSRASSMTSVASLKHRTYYTRQRARSLDLGESSRSPGLQGDEKRTKGKHKNTDKMLRGQQQKLKEQGKRKQEEKQQKKQQQQQQRGKSGWKHMCLAALKRTRIHKMEEKLRQNQEKRSGDTSRHRPQTVGNTKQEAKQRRPQTETSSRKSHEGEKRQVHYGFATTSTPQSDEIEEIRLSGQETDESTLKDKKEQGSQTRLSGAPKPRRLLLLRSTRNKVEASQQNHIQADTSSGRHESRLSPNTQDHAVAGPSGQQRRKSRSPDKQETRPKTSHRQASGISRNSTAITRQKNSINLGQSQEIQNPTPGTSQEPKPKPSKTLELARKMSRKWRRTASLDLGINIMGKQNQLTRTKSQSANLNRNPEDTYKVHSGRSSRSTHQESHQENTEGKRSAPVHQGSQSILPIRQQSDEQIETIQSQGGRHRRYSLSTEQGVQLPIITREHHKRSRSIDAVRQVGLSGSRNYNLPRGSVEVQSTTQSRDVVISEGVRREQEQAADERFYLPVPPRANDNDASDYEFEVPMMDDPELPPGHSFQIGRAEAQIEEPMTRSVSMDEVNNTRTRGMVDQVRTVEVQGSRRPYSFSDHGRTVETKGAARHRGRSRSHDRGRTSQDHRILRGSVERVPQRTSVDGVRNSQSVDIGSPERIHRHYSLDQNNDYDRRGGYDPAERRYQTASLDRRREPYIEYTRHDPTMEYPRIDTLGRGGEYRYSRTYADRDYPVGYFDRGYITESPEPRYIRADTDRRYTVGTIEPSYIGPYSERTYFRPVDNYTRGYLDRGFNARSLDNEYYRGYVERAPVAYLPGRIVESDRGYPDRIITARRWKDDDWGRGDGRRYREAIIAPHTTSLSAVSPPSDHRAL